MNLIKNYYSSDFIRDYGLSHSHVLNAGSAGARPSTRCINVDIQSKPGVDLVADIHDLPPLYEAQFEAIVCNAVLQYCKDPHKVASEFKRVLKPGGLLFVDAPWVQPFCPDTPDLFRFSEDALRMIFADFEILALGPSIRPGSAFLYLGHDIAGSATGNRYVDFVLRGLVTLALSPFAWLRTAEESKTCGAFYLIGRKK